MSWKEPKVEPSPGSFPVSEAEIKRKPDLKDLYLAVSSLAQHPVTSVSPISAILVKSEPGDSLTSYHHDNRMLPPSSRCDSTSSPSVFPRPLASDIPRKQIYDNPAIIRVNQQPSSTISIQPSQESHLLMPPPRGPPPPRDMSKKALESQLMPPPPPKVITGPGTGLEISASPPGLSRASSNYPSTSQEKEDIGKRKRFIFPPAPTNHRPAPDTAC